MVSISAGFNSSIPSISRVEQFRPLILAPIFIRNAARLVISGSIAALLIIVVPLARTAAIKILTVAPTDETSKFIFAPESFLDLAII